MSQTSAFDIHSDDGARRLLYLCAFVLFFVPLFQAFAGVWPLMLGNVEWRWKATGGFSGIMMLPFIGMVLGLAIARTCGHKGVARFIGILGALITVVLVIALGLFAMDFLQLKKIVSTRDMAGFTKVSYTALATLLMNLTFYTVMTIVAFRPPQGEMKATPPKTKFKSPAGDEAPGLLIGQDYSK